MIVLNDFEYDFLKGDKEAWPCWGAAMAVVYEFCLENRLGTFGDPTEKGKQLMEAYEITV